VRNWWESEKFLTNLVCSLQTRSGSQFILVIFATHSFNPNTLFKFTTTFQTPNYLFQYSQIQIRIAFFFKQEHHTRRSKQNKPPGGQYLELIQQFWRRDLSKTDLQKNELLSRFRFYEEKRKEIREVWGIRRLILYNEFLHSILHLKVIDSVLISLIFFSFIAFKFLVAKKMTGSPFFLVQLMCLCSISPVRSCRSFVV
jgi:hypothetical protein